MVLTTRPRKVSTLGLIRDRASQRTMRSSKTPQPRPKALVQVIGAPSFGGSLVVNRGQGQNIHFTVAIRGDNRGRVADFLIQQCPAYGRSGRDFSRFGVGFLAGYQL